MTSFEPCVKIISRLSCVHSIDIDCIRIPSSKKRAPLGNRDNDKEFVNKGYLCLDCCYGAVFIVIIIIASPLQIVKSALHTAMPTVLTGRQLEITRIKDFLLNHVATETPGSLYISGPPGTGKTAAVTQYLTNPEVIIIIITIIVCVCVDHYYYYFQLLKMNINITIMNCMRFVNPTTVYNSIYDELIRAEPKHKKDMEKQIVKFITASANMKSVLNNFQ